MKRRTVRWVNSVRGIVGAAAILVGTQASAQTPMEHSGEVRFQLDLRVPDAALRAFLPEGFTLNVATQGPAKDCNLRAIFVDRVTINDPSGKPLGRGSNRLVYLAAPVKDPSGATAQLVIAGLTEDPAEVPGPFGVYLHATTSRVERAMSNASGQMIDSQDWVFAAATGERIEMHMKAERGVGNKGNPLDVKFYSARDPKVFQLSRQEQNLDILKNTTTNPPDRVKSFSFKGGGGSYAPLFDGSEALLSWDNILWMNRTIMRPQ